MYTFESVELGDMRRVSETLRELARVAQLPSKKQSVTDWMEA